MNRLSVYLSTDKSPHKPRSSAPFSHSPLLKGISPENLRFPEQGGVGVLLAKKVQSLLQDLAQIGQVLVITRNTLSVLGEYRLFPGVILGSNGSRCMSQDGSLEFDFSLCQEIIASHEHRPQGHSYAVEFSDYLKRSLHKICLTPESRFRHFLNMVQLHQDEGLEASLTAFSRDRSSGVSASTIVTPSNSHFLPISKNALLDLLDHLCENQVEVEVQVGNPGASQRARFPIQEIKQNQEWHFVSGSKTGWHLNINGINSFHWKVPPTCSGSLWKIQAVDRRQAVIFELRGTCSLPSTLHALAALN